MPTRKYGLETSICIAFCGSFIHGGTVLLPHKVSAPHATLLENHSCPQVLTTRNGSNAPTRRYGTRLPANRLTS